MAPERPTRRHAVGLAAPPEMIKSSESRKRHADVAQLVAHHLAKVRVASSSLVIRSRIKSHGPSGPHTWWRGREARQRPAKPYTRVRIPSPPRHPARQQHRRSRAIGAAVARFPDTEEVTGSIPVSPTTKPPVTRGFSRIRASSCDLRAIASSWNGRRAACSSSSSWRHSGRPWCRAGALDLPRYVLATASHRAPSVSTSTPRPP